MVIQHNIAAMNSNRQLGITTGLQAKSSEKLSSGYKINRAADDAAGLAISEKMRRQIRGLDQASHNIQDGISLVQIADGALAESLDNLQRLNELAVKAANDTLTAQDRAYIQREVDELLKEVDRTAKATSFNDKIFPLNGDPIKKKLPDAIREIPITVVNNGTANVIYNGTTYAAGESFVIPNVLSIMRQGTDILSNAAIMGASSVGAAGYTSSTTFRISFSADTVITISTLNDLREDDNGFLYVMGGLFSLNERRYLGKWQFLTSNPPPTDPNNWYKMETVQEKSDPIRIQAGSEPGQVINIELVNATSDGLGLNSLDVSTADSARASIETVKSAIEKVADYRSHFGAKQNRLEHSYKNVRNVVENTQNAESRIRDTDMADEMVRYSNNNILAQAGQSMLAQANQTNQGVLSLLQ